MKLQLIYWMSRMVTGIIPEWRHASLQGTEIWNHLNAGAMHRLTPRPCDYEFRSAYLTLAGQSQLIDSDAIERAREQAVSGRPLSWCKDANARRWGVCGTSCTHRLRRKAGFGKRRRRICRKVRGGSGIEEKSRPFRG
jgi:hypothetical protein